LKDPKLKKNLSNNAKKHALGNFHDGIIIPQYLNLYEGVLNS
jgi:hypothetical protein